MMPPNVAVTTPMTTATIGFGHDVERAVGADDGEQRQPDRVEPQQQAVARLREMRGEEQDHGDDDADEDVSGLLHPEDGQPSEQQVAHRAAADAGYRRQQREAEDVHFLARSDESARRGKDGDAEPIDGEEE